MSNLSEQLVNYMFVAGLMGQHRRRENLRCWGSCLVALTIVIIVVCFVACLCKCCYQCHWLSQCLQIIVVPIAIVCLTYLASLLIKKIPDSDMEAERHCRMARMLLVEINRKGESPKPKSTFEECDVNNLLQSLDASTKTITDAIEKASAELSKALKDFYHKKQS